MSRRAVDVECTVDIALTAESLHAHVTLNGLDVGPGDVVVVHDAPAEIAFGQQIVCRRRATVVRAGRLRRAWTRLAGRFELLSLFEVGFSEAPLSPAAHRRKA
jgi:hypothetical protein